MQPTDPAYNPLLCAIARVVLTKTGVVSVTQITDDQITTLDKLAPIVAAQGGQLASYQNLLNGLLSSVAALSANDASRFAALTAEIVALQSALTVLGNKVASLPTTAGGNTSILSITDYYNDTSGLTVQPNNPTYTVGGGLGFPSATSTPGAFSPVNTGAGNVAFLGNRYLMPAFAEVVASLVYATAGQSIALNTLSTLTTSILTRGLGIERTRYGASLQAQASANLLGNGDPTLFFALHPGDLVYDPSWPVWTADNPELSHQNGYVHDLTSRGYWTPRQAGNPVAGVPALIQCFFPQSDQMVTGFELSVAKGTQGDIRLLVCDVVSGFVPDFTRVIADVTCPYASIDPTADIDGVYGVAAFNFPYPLLEKLGKGYAYVILSTGDHRIKVDTNQQDTAGNSGQTYGVCQGYTLVGGQNPAASGAAGIYNLNGGNLCIVGHRKKIASFAATSTPVPLNPLYNGGGTDLIDVLTPGIVPAGCDIGYSLQSGSGGLTPLGPITASAPNQLAGRPSTVVLTAVLTGTGTTAPIIDLGTSVSGTAGGSSAKQAGTLTAQSPVRTPSAPVTHITRSVTLAGFNPAVHTYTETLETGTGYATQTAPTSSTAPVKQADGTYLATFSWTLGAAVPSFMLLYQGTTSDTTQTFRISQSTTTATP